MKVPESTRVDKFLWAVRLFKTRSLASEACKNGKVKIDNQPVKPSRMVKPGETIIIIEPHLMRRYEVLNISEKRMGAPLVEGYIKDVTPAGDLEALELAKANSRLARSRGLGRPTKKERRDLDSFLDNEFQDNE